ncbi:MAG: hypothetical protein AAGA46_06470 [Cyanobacteria bacterium P01_F01_bin.13]
MELLEKAMNKILGQANLGRLDYFRYPDMQSSWGGPFNGQKFRQRIFFDLLYHCPIKAIVETGTFRGTTTAMFAATMLPVYTVERSPRFFNYSKTRFVFNRQNLFLYQNDSRSFLRELSEDDSVPKEDVFFYLDAHWKNDLPLREELDIIFSNWKRSIVMVDDFQVPNADYKYDDYGIGKTLNLDYIESVVLTHNLSVFFPAVNSSEETGAKRGSVMICPELLGEQLDAKVQTLVRHAY